MSIGKNVGPKCLNFWLLIRNFADNFFQFLIFPFKFQKIKADWALQMLKFEYSFKLPYAKKKYLF